MLEPLIVFEDPGGGMLDAGRVSIFLFRKNFTNDVVLNLLTRLASLGANGGSSSIVIHSRKIPLPLYGSSSLA